MVPLGVRLRLISAAGCAGCPAVAPNGGSIGPAGQPTGRTYRRVTAAVNSTAPGRQNHRPTATAMSSRASSTFRLQGAIWPSRTVAGRRLISHLPAPIVAGRRPASVTACLRWLPSWLPGVGDPAVIGLHISGFADRSLNSRTPQQLCPVPDHRGLQRGLHHVQQRRLQLDIICHPAWLTPRYR